MDRRMAKWALSAGVGGLLMAGLPGPGVAQQNAPLSRVGHYAAWDHPTYDGYKRTSEYVTMRDGVKIAIDVFRPTLKGQIEGRPLPVIWMNTPYNRRGFEGKSTIQDYPGAALSLIRYGYVVVIADMRGNYASFGKAVHSNRNEWMPDAYWDAYDLTEWLAKQPYSDAKIGMWGCSATGHSQWQAAATNPPHLKAIFPMSGPSEYFEWNGVSPTGKAQEKLFPAPQIDEREARQSSPVDGDESRSLLNAALNDHRWNIDFGDMPYRDDVSPEMAAKWGVKNYRYWEEANTFTHFSQINAAHIPAYETANYGEDQRVKLGVMVKLHNVTAPVKLVLGPANHCQWTSDYKVVKDNPLNISIEELRWYDYWLRGIQNGVMSEPRIYYYTYNTGDQGNTGSRGWRYAWQWPIPSTKPTRFYFAPATAGEKGAALSLTAPTARSGSDAYTVDYNVTPANRAERGFAVTSAPMEKDTEITGHPVLRLWVTSTAKDGDFFAALADVAPDGTANMLPGTDDGQLRASLRKVNPAPYDNLGLPYHRAYKVDVQPIVPAQPTELRFDLAPISWVFKKGHRLRLVLVNASPARHAGVPRLTPVLDPAPVVHYLRDAVHASSITLPVNAPFAVPARVTRGPAGTSVTLTFPAAMDARYVQDVDKGSVKIGDVAAAKVTASGHELIVRFPGSPHGTLSGRLGAAYDYGDKMAFIAPVR